MTYKEKFRRSTDWKQKVLTVELFHLLMLSKNPKWKLNDTAKYFQVSIALVSENLKLAKFIENGIVGACTSRDNALQILRKLK